MSETETVWCSCPMKLGDGCPSCIAKAKRKAETNPAYSRAHALLYPSTPEPDWSDERNIKALALDAETWLIQQWGENYEHVVQFQRFDESTHPWEIVQYEDVVRDGVIHEDEITKQYKAEHRHDAIIAAYLAGQEGE